MSLMLKNNRKTIGNGSTLEDKFQHEFFIVGRVLLETQYTWNRSHNTIMVKSSLSAVVKIHISWTIPKNKEKKEKT